MSTVANSSGSPAPSSKSAAGGSRGAATEAVRKSLHEHLRKTAGFIRILDLLVKAFAFIACVLVVWLLACVVDHWLLPLASWMRWSIWTICVSATGWFLAFQVAPLLFRKINLTYAARRIEHVVPEFKNGLVSWLELEQLPEQGVPKGVMAALAYRAKRYIGDHDPSATVDTSPLIKLLGVVLLLSVAMVGYAIASSKSVGVTGQRILMPWMSLSAPTRVDILNVSPGVTELTQGQPLTIDVELRGLRYEEPVFVRYSTLDGQFADQRLTLDTVTEGFRYGGTIRTGEYGVEQEMDYWVEAGDALAGPFRVSLNPLPTLVLESAVLTYPEYTKLPPQVQDAASAIEAVEGTKVELTARSNQTLQKANLEVNPSINERGDLIRADAIVEMKLQDRQASGSLLMLLNESGDNPTPLEYRVRGYNERMEGNPDPVVHRASVLADQPPEITLLGPENRTIKVAPDSVVEVEARANDPDFGISKVILQVRKNSKRLGETTLIDAEGLTGRQVKTATLDMRRLKPQLGDIFQITATAQDNRHDPRTRKWAPNTTVSEPLLLQVVRPDQANVPPPKSQQAAANDPSNKNEPAKNSNPSKAGESGRDSQSAGGNASSSGEQQDEQGTSSENSSGQSGSQSENSASSESSDQNAAGSGASEEGESSGSMSAANRDGSQSSSNSQSGNESSSSGNPTQGSPTQGSPPGSNASNTNSASSDNRGTGENTTSSSSSRSDNSSSQSESNSAGRDDPSGGSSNRSGSGSSSGENHSQGDSLSDREIIERVRDRIQNSEDDGNSAQQQAQPDGSNASGSSEGSGKPANQETASQDTTAQSQSPDQGENADSSESSKGDASEGSNPSNQTGSDPSANSGGQQEPSSVGQNGSEAGENSKQGDGSQGSQSDSNSGNPSSDSGNGNNGSQNGSGSQNSGSQSSSGSQSTGDSQNAASGSQNSSGSSSGESSSSGSSSGNSSSGNSSSGESSSGESGASSSGSSEGAQGGEGSTQNSSGQRDSSGSPNSSGAQGSNASETSAGSAGDAGANEGDNPQSGTPSSQDAAGSESAGSGSGGQSSKPNSQGTGDQQGESAETGNSQPGSGGQSSQAPGGSSSSGSPGQAEGGAPPKGGGRGGPGTGSGSGAEAGAGGDSGTRDNANADYADKTTQMVLDYLDRQKEQPDPELLRDLDWTKDDLQEFVQRWKNARDLGTNGSERDRTEWKNQLKDLGLQPPRLGTQRGSAENDTFQQMQDAGSRARVPASWRREFEAFQKALQQQ